MTRIAVAVVLAVVAVGCGDDFAASPDCTTRFDWGGDRYVGLGSAGPEVAGCAARPRRLLRLPRGAA